jgi:hypothetical protein
MTSAKRTILITIAAIVVALVPIGCETKQPEGTTSAMPSDDDPYAQAVAYRTVEVGALSALKPGTTIEECLSSLHTLGRHECTCLGGDREVITIHSVFLYSALADRASVDLPMFWLVFRDGRYAKTVEYVNHSSVDGIISAQESRCDVMTLVDRMRARAMAAVASEARDLSKTRFRPSDPADPGLSAAFLLFGGSLAGSVKRNEVVNHRLLVAYSGDKVGLGDSPGGVAAALGQPAAERRDMQRPDSWIAQYGDFQRPSVSGQYEARPLIVIYTAGRAIMVISNEFYLECVGYRKEGGIKVPMADP